MHKILFFPYFGPNRHSDRRVVEIRLNPDSDDSCGFTQQVSVIKQSLLDAEILNGEKNYFDEPLPDDRMKRDLALLAQTALLFQRENGHQVDYFSVSCKPDKSLYTVLVEHENSKVGMAAVNLAIGVFSGKSDSLKEAYRSFSEFAHAGALSLETKTIINRAKRQDIPFLQLEREPLSGHFNTGFRVRRNGLLILGHGVNHHILDGVFCVDRAGDYLKALLRNPDQRLALLKQLEIPTTQAGYKDTTATRQVCLLVINGKITAVEQLASHSMQVVNGVHQSLLDMALSISEKVGFAPVAVHLKVPGLSQSLAQTGGAVQDFDLAPDLNQLLGRCEEGPGLLEAAADDLIDWLFPAGQSPHIPIIAITGTNGKTTTSRMLTHIMQSSGRKPGLVCSNGIFLGGKQISKSDASSFIGHARVLSSESVDVAVLEAHHRGIAVRGFAFQSCDVAICLNVTNDHLQKGEIETVEQMAVIKRALPERASRAAVLFADDPNCVAMLDFMKADFACLVSLQSGIEQLHELVAHKPAGFCVLETVEDQEWIVLYDGQQRLAVMPVSKIPATHNGTARFNISNAMHAITASYFVGISIEKMAAAMTSFNSGFDSTPGRLNIFDELPFRVVMDYAHNADGFRKISEFVDNQSVSGRKILMLGYSGDRLDSDVRAAVTEVVGHFDHFVCRDYKNLRSRKAQEMPAFLKSELRALGVAESDISLVPDAEDSVRYSLAIAKPGDLLVLFTGSMDFQFVRGLLNSMAETAKSQN